ncbi:MAG: hypothetical protein M0Z51_11590 [Propionibacterium sp.]|nr:hypothetical protein [Propionibacterium sp.]
MSSTPIIAMPPGDGEDPLGLGAGDETDEADRDDGEPSVITLDEVERAAEGNSDN